MSSGEEQWRQELVWNSFWAVISGASVGARYGGGYGAVIGGAVSFVGSLIYHNQQYRYMEDRCQASYENCLRYNPDCLITENVDR